MRLSICNCKCIEITKFKTLNNNKNNKMKLINNVDKLGTLGLFFTALFSPCCFPLFAFAASALGLGSFELFGGWTMWIFQAMVLISIVGLIISYRKHRCLYPLLIAIPSGITILFAYYFSKSENKLEGFFSQICKAIFTERCTLYTSNKHYKMLDF